MKRHRYAVPAALAAALSLTACAAGADTGADPAPASTAAAPAPGVTVYTTEIAPLTEVDGVAVQASAHGSALAAVPGTTDEFYGLTDRGPNVDGVADGQKVEPTPDFVPQIGRFRLADGRAELLSTITLTAPDGVGFNGQVHPDATTGETIVDLAGEVLPTSEHGLDPEGLVALPDGTFWISDEYGPFLVHVDAQGREIERLSPGHGLPAELALRTPNQGMEGLTITPDGSTLVGMMQSALRAPGLDGNAKSVPLTRIVTVDLNTRAVKEYGYLLDDPKDTKKAVSAITAVSPTEFLVVERDGRLAPGANKVIYRIDTARATDIGPTATVPNSEYRADAGGLLIGGRAVETLVGVTDADTARQRLAALGVTPVDKTVALDLGDLVDTLNAQGEFYGHDKIEGLSTPDGGKTLYIVNDSDFGLVGLANATPPFALEPKILANGTQDTTEFLVVDTTEFPVVDPTALPAK